MAETKQNIAAPAEAPLMPITFKKRNAKAKGNIRERPPTPVQSSSDDDDYSSEDNSGHRVKRRKKNTGAVVASSKSTVSSDKDLSATVFKADRNASITDANDATKRSNWYDEESKGHDSKNKDSKDGHKKSVGPVKAPTNVRMTVVTDFAPDVCKDYKQTGFCGFGDNCKYLHAREDYKAGWQLDREWETATMGKKNIGGSVVANANRNKTQDEDEDEDAMLANIPFACIICRESYKNPIVTRCGHYFCEACALKRYRKDPSCAACGAGTNGVFNTAKNLKKLLERKKERAAALGEDDEDGSDDDDA
jgi:RING finger protein 113A